MSRIQKGAVNLDFENAEMRFQSAFQRLLLNSKKSTQELWEQQVGGIVRNLFSVTPPMGGTEASYKFIEPGSNKKPRGIVIKFAEGKAKGQSTIESDIQRAFERVNKPNSDALSQYLARRQKNKRFRRFGEPIKATLTDINAVRKNIEGRQGTTASGWMSAVQKLSVSGIPNWITRHGTKVPSRCNVSTKPDGYSFFEAINGTNHSSSSAIERRIAIAISMQAGSIERWLKAYNENLLREALR
jgi:hypothetical protein